MKYSPKTGFTIVTIITIVLILVGNFKPDLYDLPDREVTAQYDLGRDGPNDNIVEFTPVGNPNYVCILTTGVRQVMECIPRSQN